MSDVNTDVDLDKELGIESEESKTSGASDQKKEDVAVVDPDKEDFSPRAKQRVDELLGQIETLKKSNLPADTDADVEKFLSAIQDEPSRELLRSFGQIIEKKVEKRFSPVLSNFQEQQFDKEFAAFASDPDIAPFKDDFKKTFERNPNVSLKALIGEKLVDLRTKRVPIERADQSAPRGGKANLDDMGKDDLYDLLESQKS